MPGQEFNATRISIDLKLPKEDPIFQRLVDKGRRGKWWRRNGSMAKGFSYCTHDGRKLEQIDSLERIKALVIPPAWRYVRISPASTGKLQAVGIDTGGRLQYIYHPKFAEMRQRKKFARIERFGEYMPQLRRQRMSISRSTDFPVTRCSR